MLPFPLGTAPLDANVVRRGIEARYRGAHTLKATFYQRYSSGNGGGTAESGTVYFSRPGRMRWEYESPEPKLFLVDGANAWFYVPADRTASRATLKQSSDWRTPVALLAGKADLDQLCRSLEIVSSPSSPHAAGPTPGSGDAASLQPLDPNDTVLRCTPRGAPKAVTSLAPASAASSASSPASSAAPDDDNSAPREILIETDPNYYITRVLIRQAGGLETEFRFGNWQENLPISELKFHFQPPPGVAVVDEQSLANSLK
ncbi:MAG: outer membrane lipoprotein carrier protein LolA [Candidatus Acidiferrales bacterium]